MRQHSLEFLRGSRSIYTYQFLWPTANTIERLRDKGCLFPEVPSFYECSGVDKKLTRIPPFFLTHEKTNNPPKIYRNNVVVLYGSNNLSVPPIKSRQKYHKVFSGVFLAAKTFQIFIRAYWNGTSIFSHHSSLFFLFRRLQRSDFSSKNDPVIINSGWEAFPPGSGELSGNIFLGIKWGWVELELKNYAFPRNAEILRVQRNLILIR